VRKWIRRERERGFWVMFVEEDGSWNVSRSKGVGQGNLLCNLRFKQASYVRCY
jgi:hypothetical protein